MVRQNVKLRNGFYGIFPKIGGIGGVDENEAEFFPGGGEEGGGVAADDPCPVLQAGELQVVPDEGGGVPPLVHEDGGGRAPAEGLDAQLAGSGVEVQDFSSFYVELDDIEDAFFYPVGGGAGLIALQLF